MTCVTLSSMKQKESTATPIRSGSEGTTEPISLLVREAETTNKTTFLWTHPDQSSNVQEIRAISTTARIKLEAASTMYTSGQYSCPQLIVHGRRLILQAM